MALIDFYNLTNLKKISGNGIETIHSSNGIFSASEGRQLRLMNLEELDLGDNFLNNSLLAYLSRFPNLKSLDISGNKLKGSIDIKGT
ncbi:hypothetical protein PTKIN_Ptkin09bG0270800 [Pterospermum kingtungense]